MMRSLALQPATSTQPTVLVRSLAIQLAASTQPTVMQRFKTTPPAMPTRPTVISRSRATQPASAIRPPVIKRSSSTQQATATPPMALTRFLVIQPAASIRQSGEVIHALKPVTFHYKKDLDPAGIPQFGLVAEEVAKVNPDLVARDDQGKIYTVRYDAVNAMLLNEFLKEHRTVQELKSNAAKQEATIAKQQTQIEALISGLQKVSDQLELSKPAPRTVKNNQ